MLLEVLFLPDGQRGYPSTVRPPTHTHERPDRSILIFASSLGQAARISGSELWVIPPPSSARSSEAGRRAPRSPFPAGRGRRSSSAAAQRLPRGTSLAPPHSGQVGALGPANRPLPASPTALGRAQRASGLLREGTAGLKIAAKLGGREGLSEDAAPSPWTAAGCGGSRWVTSQAAPEAPVPAPRPARWAPYPPTLFSAFKFLGVQGARMDPDESSPTPSSRFPSARSRRPFHSPGSGPRIP